MLRVVQVKNPNARATQGKRRKRPMSAAEITTSTRLTASTSNVAIWCEPWVMARKKPATSMASTASHCATRRPHCAMRGRRGRAKNTPVVTSPSASCAAAKA